MGVNSKKGNLQDECWVLGLGILPEIGKKALYKAKQIRKKRKKEKKAKQNQFAQLRGISR